MIIMNYPSLLLPSYKHSYLALLTERLGPLWQLHELRKAVAPGNPLFDIALLAPCFFLCWTMAPLRRGPPTRERGMMLIARWPAAPRLRPPLLLEQVLQALQGRQTRADQASEHLDAGPVRHRCQVPSPVAHVGELREGLEPGDGDERDSTWHQPVSFPAS